MTSQKSSELTNDMIIKSMTEIAGAIKLQNPKMLLGRSRGKEALPHLISAIEDTPEGHYLLLEFNQDQICDSSFIDETLIEVGSKLINGDFGERGMVLSGLGENTWTSLRSTLAMRRDDARKAGEDFKVVFLTFASQPSEKHLSTSQWEVLGSLEQSLLDVIHLLTRYDSISAADVAREFDLEINTASMRLKRLYQRHLLKRSYQTLANGREFIYSFWS